MGAIRKNTRYCQFTKSQAGDGEAGDITGEPGWDDVLIAMFFSVDISYVISELLKREELRRFAKLVEIPEAKDIYLFLGRFDEKQFIGLVIGVLGSIC